VDYVIAVLAGVVTAVILFVVKEYRRG